MLNSACLIFLLLCTHFFSYSRSETVQVTASKVKTELIVGSQFKQISYIIKALSRPLAKSILEVDPVSFTKPLVVSNRLLLYGPPGNGKSTLAREIADAADCEFVHISAPGIVTKFQGSGSENIKKEFKKALDKVVESGRPIVMLIDEIDAIAITGKGDSASDNERALQELWQYLDKFKNDPRIFVVCTTNRFDDLNSVFLSRFEEDHKIHIDNPGEAMREKMLIKFSKDYDADIADQWFSCLAYHSNTLSIRDLENLIAEINKTQIFDSKLTRKEILEKIIEKKRSIARDNKNSGRTVFILAGAFSGGLPGLVGNMIAVGAYDYITRDSADYCKCRRCK